MSNNRSTSENKFGNNTVVIQGNNNAPINAGSPEEDTSWLEKISQTNPTYDKKRILESKGPFLHESFRWVLDNSDFNKWRNTEKSGVFWIKGDPGKGKTMLLGGLVDDFEKSPQIGINLAYFFCQATDSRINTVAAVVGGLIVSFMKQHQELLCDIHKKYKDELGKLSGPDRWYILRDMFEKVTQHSALPNPVCVVDALDECEQEHGCKQLLRLIIETSCRVKWLISSRNIPEIERELQAIDSGRRLSLELKENADYVTKSVDLYIDHSIRNIAALKGDEELLIKATDTLKRKANGTFLWVALVIEQLRDTKHRNVEEVLEKMPEGLDNLYNLILKRLARHEDKDAYQVLLSTVTAAERPLRLEELFTFMGSQWKYFKPTYTVRDIRDIVKDCGSFLSIRDKTVYFIHQSVKDYMMGTAVKAIIFPSGIEYQHYKMFTTSLSAMSRILKHNIYSLKDPGSDIETISPPDPDPLAPIAYCCLFWIEHLFQSCESGASRDKVFLKDGKILHSFLKVKYLCWLESLALLRGMDVQGIDAIQKLKNLLSGYYKCEAIRCVAGGSSNPRGEREKTRYRFIHRCKDLSLGTYIDYAYTFFYHYDDSQVRAFINDAYQFFHYCEHYVSKYPLQLYHSAFTFEDTRSAIYTTFQHTIRAETKNTPTCIKMPHKHFSLVQNIPLKGRGSIVTLLYSPDSSLLCSLSFGGTVSLYRTDTYCLERVIELDMETRHNLLAFSSDSKHLLSITSTGIVQVWAVDCGTQIQNFSLNLHTSLVPDPERPFERNEIVKGEVIALSRHGDLAASVCRTQNAISVKVWAIKAGECICTIDQSHMPGFCHATFSPNLEMVALIGWLDTRVCSAQTGQEIKYIRFPGDKFPNYAFQTDFIRHSRFSPDSKLLAMRRTSQTIDFWSTETWTMVRQICSEESTGPFDVSPDATMSVFSCGDAVLIVSIDTGELLLSIESHVSVHCPLFSPDWTNSSLLASFNGGRLVQIWRTYSNIRNKSSEIQSLPSREGVAISPKSKYVATWDSRGDIEIWSGESGERTQIIKGSALNHEFYSFPAFSPNSELMACAQGEKGDIQIWHVETGKLLHLFKGPDAEGKLTVSHCSFSDDSGYVVAGYTTGQVKVWCVESGKCLCDYDKDDGPMQVLEVAISPSSKYVAAAFLSMRPPLYITLTVWRTDRRISQVELRGNDWGSFFCLQSLTFSSDATVLVIITGSTFSSGPYKADFYDVTSGALLSHIDIGESKYWPFFDPANDHIVSDRLRLRRTSSWKHWDAIPIPRPGYSYLNSVIPMEGFQNPWICFGENKVFQIPRQLFTNRKFSISSRLLAFKNTVGELYIVQLPSQDNIE